jgi:hypothetical protein
MKRIPGISALVLIWIMSGHIALSQDADKAQSKTIKKEVKVTIDDESGDPSYSVEITTTENGEKKVVKKTYSSLEEMKEDTSIEVFNPADKDGNITIKLGDKGSGVMVFTSEEGETGNSFSFITDEGDSNQMVKSYKIKVIKDGGHADHDIHEYKNVFVIKDEDGNISVTEGGDTEVMVWVDEEGNKTIKRSFHKKIEKTAFIEANIQPIPAGDEAFSSFNLAAMPELVLKSINYYPNPKEGEFTLAFSGSKKAVIVRILDIKGNMKMEENIEDFNGTFNQVLNVKNFDKGTYLLQIFQQDKVLNRKLILE